MACKIPPSVDKSKPTRFPVGANVLSLYGIFKQLEITSFDGKPFITPQEFISRALQEQKVGPQEEPKEPVKPKAKNAWKTGVLMNKRQKKALHKRLKKQKEDAASSFSEYDIIKKKVKKEVRMLSPSTQEGDMSELGRSTVESGTQTDIIMPEKEFGTGKRVLQTEYNEEKHELMFKIESWSIQGERSLREMTRDDVIKEDPRMLLYFYENHLEFPKVPHFRPERLGKLCEKEACLVRKRV